MEWSSDPYYEPVAIIVPADPNVCHYNKSQRIGSNDVLEKTYFHSIVNVWYTKVLWIKCKKI